MDHYSNVLDLPFTNVLNVFFFFLNKMTQSDAFNLSTKEPEAGGSLSKRPSWSK